MAATSMRHSVLFLMIKCLGVIVLTCGVIPESWVKASDVHTAGEPVPWSVFTRYLRRPAHPRSTGRGGNSGSRSRFDDELLQLLQLEYPWLTIAEIMELLKMNSPQASAQQPRASPLPSGASSSSTGQGSSRPEAQELPEDVVAQVHQNLEAIRAEVAEGNMEDRCYFKLKTLGGEWSIRQGKRLTTDFQPIAKDKSAAKCCETHTHIVSSTEIIRYQPLWPHQCSRVGRGGGEERRLFVWSLDRSWLPSAL